MISSTAAGEIHERVVDDVNGYLVPPDDPDALAAAMRRLAADPALRSRMGARSADMIAPCTPDRWAEAFEKAVAGILATPRIRRVGAWSGRPREAFVAPKESRQ